MARLGRLFVPGYPQLVLQRGNNGAALFLDEEDYRQFLHILRESAREASLAIHAYVLMPDHVHLLLSAPTAEAVSSAVQRLGRGYVRWFNDKHHRSGTLWEGRYRSTAVEPRQYSLACYRYIESNPVRRGLAPDVAAYPWASGRHHLGLAPDPLISDHACYWALGNTPFERQGAYQRHLDSAVPPGEIEAIRYAGHRGWLLGEVPSQSESGMVRRTHPLAKGRPKQLADDENPSAS